MLLLPVLFLDSCATYHTQYGRETITNADTLQKSPLLHTFYLIGDAGNADKEDAVEKLKFMQARLSKAKKESTLLFLGDNIYPAGMPAKDKPERLLAEQKMNNQFALAKDFKGKTIFIPGNHDWYSESAQGLKREEKYVNDKFSEKKSFMPKNGCAIEELKVNDKISMIVIDSQWYLENWDDIPNINDDCDIKTREDFFDELADLINKNQNKTTIIAIHHPIISNGVHGGQYSMYKQIFPFQSDLPLPVLGTLLNVFRRTSGLDPQDAQDKRYGALVKRISALIKDEKNIIVVSGHEHNLQYIENETINQIISGAGSKSEAARAVHSKDFSYGGNGYAVLQVYEKGESVVTYYGLERNKETMLYRHQITFPKEVFVPKTYPSTFKNEYSASVYDSTLTRRNVFHNFFWGKHYRKYYAKSIKVKAVSLDTLYGGLKPEIEGGGHQSLSLRLTDKNKKPYVMRALKKSAVRFLQTVAFKNQSIEEDFKNTYAESFLLDFYTSSHPYTPFVVSKMADAIGLKHTNPKLFYVPKQNALGLYNEEFGDGLYMIEERPADGFENLKSFGKPEKIVSTEDVLANIAKDQKYKVDEKEYIRARIFDMLIGDWSRHHDQWKWGEYTENGNVIYRPIPRDRDQAFPKYDGALLYLVMKNPALRHMHTYKKEMGNVKWFNMEAYPLDLAFITASDKKVWEEQADFIQKKLTDAIVENAFLDLPKEVQDETSIKIMNNLKSRKKHLKEYAARYYEVLQKTVVIVGTDKKDKFSITRMPGGKTEVKVFRIKDDKEVPVSNRTYNRNETREIWIYGLDNDDIFEVKGKGSRPIRLRLLGGLENDGYVIENGRKVNIYDYKTKKNDIKADSKTSVLLTDDYNINNYDYKKPKYNAIAGLPNIGFNPDDGIKAGANINYTVNSFKRNPFSQKHNLKVNYYFATKGTEILYKGTFPNILRNWKVLLEAQYTSPVFSFNFFGYGNETKNYDDALGMDYNRVRIQIMKVAPSMRWDSDAGTYFSAQATFTSMEVDQSTDRYIGSVGVVDPSVYDTKNFAGANLKYGFENYDNTSLPTLGMKFYLEAGVQSNTKDTKRTVPHIEGLIGLSHKITSNGKFGFWHTGESKIPFQQ
ncbi:metallophosphoesterase [Flavobacterium sp. 3HN19-14]|uniref:metallophosphoesterase n=1 Tax=Flavobacterium sp. 3HN19-14 TaxID=3448133 RepID=UPI003EE30F38